MLTETEFSKRLESLGPLKEVAEDLNKISGLKVTPTYLSAMKNGRRPITGAVMIYVYLMTEGREPTNAELLKMIEARLK